MAGALAYLEWMDLPDLPADSALTHGFELHTRWSDEDNQKVLNNAVYLTLFEEARLRYFSSLGLVDDGRFPFLLAQTHLKFLRPGKGGVPVTVRMGTTRLGNSSFEQAYRIAGPGGEVWCEGGALLVCYDPQTGDSQPMAAEFRRLLEGVRQA